MQPALLVGHAFFLMFATSLAASSKLIACKTAEECMVPCAEDPENAERCKKSCDHELGQGCKAHCAEFAERSKNCTKMCLDEKWKPEHECKVLCHFDANFEENCMEKHCIMDPESKAKACKNHTACHRDPDAACVWSNSQQHCQCRFGLEGVPDHGSGHKYFPSPCTESSGCALQCLAAISGFPLVKHDCHVLSYKNTTHSACNCVFTGCAQDSDCDLRCHAEYLKYAMSGNPQFSQFGQPKCRAPGRICQCLPENIESPEGQQEGNAAKRDEEPGNDEKDEGEAKSGLQ